MTSKNSIKTKYAKLFNALRKEKIETWFDLTLYLDRLKVMKKSEQLSANSDVFIKKIINNVGFISFDFGIDGASIEVAKYGRAIENIYKNNFKNEKVKNNNISLIGGYFTKEAGTIFPKSWK